MARSGLVISFIVSSAIIAVCLVVGYKVASFEGGNDVNTPKGTITEVHKVTIKTFCARVKTVNIAQFAIVVSTVNIAIGFVRV